MTLQVKSRGVAIASMLGCLIAQTTIIQNSHAQEASGAQKESSAQNESSAPSPRPQVTGEMTSTDLLNLLVSKGVISKEAAVELITNLRKRAERAQQAPEGKGTENSVVVPYIPTYIEERIAENVKRDLAKQIVEDAKKEGLAIPDWVKKVRVSGDVRVRYSGEFYPGDNPEDYAVYDTNAINDAKGTSAAGRKAWLNIADDRQRLLGRARLRVTANPADNFEVGLRMTSGSLNSPVSANQTFGRYGGKWESHIDLAYIQYNTDLLKLIGGRMESSWMGTDLVWDRDMTFEGLFGQISPFKWKLGEKSFSLYSNVGVFPLQEIHQFKLPGEALNAPGDKWLYSASLGGKIQIAANHDFESALMIHEFKNITGLVNEPGQNNQNPSASPFFQWGNVTRNIAVSLPGGSQEELYALAGEFELANLAMRYNYSGFDRYQLSVSADYVQNMAWDAEDVSAAVEADSLLPDRDKGYQLEAGFGTKSRNKRGDWSVSVAYRYLEGDAVVDAFADSDFLMGGTNAQGFIIKGQQFVADNVAVELTVNSADEIDFPSSVNDDGSRDVREQAVMLDISAKF